MSSELKLTTGSKVTTTVIPWQIQQWDFTRRRRDKITFDNICPAQHSFECSFSFCINSVKNEHCWMVQSLFEVKLSSNNGLKSKLFVTVFLKNDASKYPPFTADIEPVDLPSNHTEVLRFNLPILERGQYNDLERYVENNSLTIYTKIEEFIEIKKVVDDVVLPSERIMLQTDVFGEFFKSRAFTDVLFIVGRTKQQFHAHAVILAAVCPYFSSMLNGSNMKEQKTRTVDLSSDSDISVEAFQGFLDYVYGIKKVQDMSDIVKDLAVLADKYNFSQLIQACDRVLCESLCEDNVVSLLGFAYRYKFKLLKKKTLNLAISCGIKSENFSGNDDVSELLRDLLCSLSI
ncbi:hypothetical protein QAD02_004829 [Eretmocerus hayati]|uniref:Uncharacterized protein n=1 Tax=Eretmocerus hayati TaxID=131215 RepID=A0ACC2NR36_9HYME|nr:hypothetical protein QAD02_004829 [Eretmocerus hayati]